MVAMSVISIFLITISSVILKGKSRQCIFVRKHFLQPLHAKEAWLMLKLRHTYQPDRRTI